MSQTKEEITAERDRLAAENSQLREDIALARDGVRTPTSRPKPRRPDFGLSAGEAADLETHGVTVSPFTGETLTAELEGVEPGNDAARRRSAYVTERLAAGPAPRAAARRDDADDAAALLADEQ